MPIPTRSQSVKIRGESGIPTRTPSVRQAEAPPIADRILSGSQATTELSNSTHRSRVTGIPQTRSSTRSIATQNKPGSQTRTTSSQNQGLRQSPTDTSSLESKKPSQIRQQHGVAINKPFTRTHTRSASNITVRGPEVITTRPGKSFTAVPRETRSTLPAKSIVKASTEASERTHSLNNDTQASHLHDELLQLQILHESSESSLAAYKLSISDIVNRETTSTIKQQDEILQLEARNTQAISLSALKDWLNANQEYHDRQQLQLLSTTLADLDRCMQDSGDLVPLQQFEAWLANAITIRDCRDQHLNTGLNQDLKFVPSLGATWHEDMSQLRSRMSNALTILLQLGSVEGDSGIGVVLEKSTAFASLLLQEVDAAMLLEKSMTKVESTAASYMLEEMLSQMSSVDQNDRDTLRSGAWVQ